MTNEVECFSVRAAAVLTLTSLLVGCLSSGAGAQASAASTMLFAQPSLDGIVDNFFVPAAEHRPPRVGIFTLILWQPNPNRQDGKLVPTDWSAGERTGFYPSVPLARHQAGFRDVHGTSTVQADGDTVGAYINSADLPTGSHQFKMMITPQIIFAPPDQVRPYEQAGRAVVVSLELQVPTAVDGHNDGSDTYVSADLVFVDRNRSTKISYGCNLFFNGHPRRRPVGNIALDLDTQNMMINSAVGWQHDWLTALGSSAVSQSAPWKGWKAFNFAITENNFVSALAALNQKNPGVHASVNPADYTLVQFHLNAELHFKTSAAELGWSMRRAKIEITDAALVH
jgi:hypothetical protein